jgi:(1->4)-alpha-D-glucan 1-alpha-D-glucosylmutase
MNETLTQPAPVQRLFDPQALRQRLRERLRVPVSTYRLQLHHGFTFRNAAAAVPYLERLGITDCYCSPYLQARPGSTHGYDITDHTTLNTELGSEADFQALGSELRRRHMGQVLDFVPNHMGVDPVNNHWWRDVLENGPASPFARYFDIDWEPVKSELKGKVLLPVLGGPYGEVLERGELKLDFEDGAFVLRYFDTTWPLDPGQFPRVLSHGLEALQAKLPADDPQLQEFLSILTQLEHLPPTAETAPLRVAERQREKKVARERLARLVEQVPRIREHIDAILKAGNGTPGQPETFDRLHRLLEGQPYRLAYWKTALDEINYRRFFEINDLAGVRMEDPAVFAATHALILRLVHDGQLSGLRLDHLDGLFDPAGYLVNLQEAVFLAEAADLLPGESVEDADVRRALRDWRDGEHQANPGGAADRPLYLVAEKILSGNETVPDWWPLHGTSGYDYMNDLNRLFVDAQNAKRMKQVYARFTGQSAPFSEVVYECKRLIASTSMASELNVLAHVLNRISEGDRRLRDFTLASLRKALREVVACFPVYRTYVNPAGETETDAQMIEVALSRARRRNPAMEPSVFSFVRGALLPQTSGELDEAAFRQRLDFAMKLQQYTGPVQAKGVEDTAFYRYNVLLSLNEVGGDPQRFGGSVAQFHELNRRRREHWPHAMLATATHDTKRGEDARARLNVLSEIPQEWQRALSRWARLNAGLRTKVDGEPAPDRNEEYFFYQTLIGAWPAEPGETAPAELIQRVSEYLTKALKEAKVHSSWINPNEAYDGAVTRFVERTLTGPRSGRFLADFLPFQRRIARMGMINSLAQLALKMVTPGVPDFYQGTELWDLSLVDPDNRRPVDYAHRTRMLDALEPLLGNQDPPAGAVAELLEHWEDGRIKLYLTACGLRLRRRLPRVFLDGDYLPLEVEGEHADQVVALARRHEQQWVVAVVPRLISRLIPPGYTLPLGPEVWQNTYVLLPPELGTAGYRNALTGERLRSIGQQGKAGLAVGEVLRSCPVALLVKDGSAT